ncbi:MAG TPA: high-affinity branched-chain amino acid ABC transporter permease LivH [Alphaproteobacteria bacterium]|nr:high-affinity branched-chain amino acid ABC transporter permease LivH [Alphaproteobacteria bacterium]
MEYFLQQLINGLTLGSVYALIAIGYTMVYGIIGMINFAHGDVYMIGGFVAVITLAALSSLGLVAAPLAIFAAFICAVAVTAAYGYAIERVAYRPLRQSSRIAPLISAIGVSILLQNYVRLVQGARSKPLPALIHGQYTLMERADGFAVTITNLQIAIFVLTALLMIGLTLLIHKTPLGRAQRACEQDMKMAALLGIPVERVISLTFVLGAALAAVAGTMVALYYGVVDFFIGFLAGMKAFTAAVLGGIGSLPGAMLGGVLIGLIEAFWSGYVSAEYKDVAAFLILILVLLVRPQGLLGRPVADKI